jgi:hypothetical protein
MSDKLVRKIHPALRDDIGDLITQRPVPSRHLDQVDPFLFLNHHGPQTYPAHNRGLPFGPHPHRGFETVTFILEGMLMHKDSAGYESVIRAGGVQWMTAGSGLIHAEISPPEFLQSGGPLEILQLWVNLPPHLKMTKPAYTGLQKDEIPEIALDGGRVSMHLSAGEWEGIRGPVQSLTGVFMSTIAFQPGGRIRVQGLAERNVFLYIVRGALQVGMAEDRIGACHLVELGSEGEEVELAAPEGALVLFGHAEPIGAPVVSHGPFVMNSRAEIEQAIRDYQAGKFGPPM